MTVLVNDAAMGCATYDCNELTETPLNGYYFDHWNDGNTSNPRPIVYTQDTTFTAFFNDGTPRSISELTQAGITITAHDDMIIVRGAENQTIQIFDILGRVIHTENIFAPERTFRAPSSGVYIVQVGTFPARKVVVIE